MIICSRKFQETLPKQICLCRFKRKTSLERVKNLAQTAMLKSGDPQYTPFEDETCDIIVFPDAKRELVSRFLTFNLSVFTFPK